MPCLICGGCKSMKAEQTWTGRIDPADGVIDCTQSTMRVRIKTQKVNMAKEVDHVTQTHRKIHEFTQIIKERYPVMSWKACKKRATRIVMERGIILTPINQY